MNQPPMNTFAMRLATWSGPLLTLFFFIGLVPLANLIPPPHPSESAAEIKEFYVAHTNGVRWGAVFMMIAVGLIAPFGAAMAVWIKRTESRYPILTYVQLVCVAVGTMVGVLIPLMWGVAAFRPEDTSADVTRLLNDLGWFFFLFDWPPFVIWFVALALGILGDKSPTPAFPRWSGYMTLWVAFLTVPAGMMIFFKSGPFSYTGFITMYIPLGVFFIWIVVMSPLMLQAIRREELTQRSADRASGGSEPSAAPAAVTGVR